MDFLLRHIAKKYLIKKSREYMKIYPQYACYAFDFITLRIHMDGIYERPYLEGLSKHVFPFLPSRNVCLDIGANIGNHSLFFSKFFRKVYSFEPNKNTFNLLEINSKNAQNIECYNIGLSDASAEVEVQVSRYNLGGASLNATISQENDQSYITKFKLQSLVEFWKNKNEKIDFIKMDIEGHEEKCIIGAADILARDLPVIVLEILSSDTEDPLRPLRLLKDMGYNYFMKLDRKRKFYIFKENIASLEPLSFTEPLRRNIKMAICSAFPLV